MSSQRLLYPLFQKGKKMMKGRIGENGEEVFDVRDFLITVEVRSRYVSGAVVVREVGILCPRCGAVCRSLSHGEKTQCGNCGLGLQLWGAGLHLSGEVK